MRKKIILLIPDLLSIWPSEEPSEEPSEGVYTEAKVQVYTEAKVPADTEADIPAVPSFTFPSTSLPTTYYRSSCFLPLR